MESPDRLKGHVNSYATDRFFHFETGDGDKSSKFRFGRSFDKYSDDDDVIRHGDVIKIFWRCFFRNALFTPAVRIGGMQKHAFFSFGPFTNMIVIINHRWRHCTISWSRLFLHSHQFYVINGCFAIRCQIAKKATYGAEYDVIYKRRLTWTSWLLWRHLTYTSSSYPHTWTL